MKTQIDDSLIVSATMTSLRNSQSEMATAIRNICKNTAVRDTQDAAMIMQALGLIPYR